MTYQIHSEATHARKGDAFASFPTFAAARAYVEENFLIRCFEVDEDHDAADMIVNYAKSPNGIPFCLSIEAA